MDLSMLHNKAIAVIIVGAVMLILSVINPKLAMRHAPLLPGEEPGSERRVRKGRKQLVIGGIALIIIDVVCRLLPETL